MAAGNFTFRPRNDGQKLAERFWPRAKRLFLLGPAGTGKTACAAGLVLKQAQREPDHRLILTRPTVALDDEDIGFLPGTAREKMEPWVASIADALSGLVDQKWANKALASAEIWPLAMCRGRTIRSATLVVDEAQNLTPGQVKCLLTRVGENGRVVFCGDPMQSDVANERYVPVRRAASRLNGKVNSVGVVWFAAADQVRDPDNDEILRLLAPKERP